MGNVRKVLIVDNDEVSTMISEKVLKSVDEYLEITICVDGKAAISNLLLKANHINQLPDIILLDIDVDVFLSLGF